MLMYFVGVSNAVLTTAAGQSVIVWTPAVLPSFPHLPYHSATEMEVPNPSAFLLKPEKKDEAGGILTDSRTTSLVLAWLQSCSGTKALLEGCPLEIICQ